MIIITLLLIYINICFITALLINRLFIHKKIFCFLIFLIVTFNSVSFWFLSLKVEHSWIQFSSLDVEGVVISILFLIIVVDWKSKIKHRQLSLILWFFMSFLSIFSLFLLAGDFYIYWANFLDFLNGFWNLIDKNFPLERYSELERLSWLIGTIDSWFVYTFLFKFFFLFWIVLAFFLFMSIALVLVFWFDDINENGFDE